jgi:hypothetical protein
MNDRLAISAAILITAATLARPSEAAPRWADQSALPAPRDAEAVMARIEAKTGIPSGAPIASYDRFYAYAGDGGGKIVVAIYVRHDPGGPGKGRRWVAARDLPLIFDGGCSVVNLLFDLEADKVVKLSCNGRA